MLDAIRDTVYKDGIRYRRYTMLIGNQPIILDPGTASGDFTGGDVLAFLVLMGIAAGIGCFLGWWASR
jgi:hypothetical protein